MAYIESGNLFNEDGEEYEPFPKLTDELPDFKKEDRAYVLIVTKRQLEKIEKAVLQYQKNIISSRKLSREKAKKRAEKNKKDLVVRIEDSDLPVLGCKIDFALNKREVATIFSEINLSCKKFAQDRKIAKKKVEEEKEKIKKEKDNEISTDKNVKWTKEVKKDDEEEKKKKKMAEKKRIEEEIKQDKEDIKEFIIDKCSRGENEEAPFDELKVRYKEWRKEEKLIKIPKGDFERRLKEGLKSLGHDPIGSSTRLRYSGIGFPVKTTDDSSTSKST